MAKYRALVGMNIPADQKESDRVIKAAADGINVEDRKFVRYEAGDEITFIPTDDLVWLLEQKCIEEVK